MSIMLFKLRGVPEEEANEIRRILSENNIAYYETPVSIWGVSMQAIWLKDDQQLEQARGLIGKYQDELRIASSSEYLRRVESGENETFIFKLFHNPVRIILYIIGILLLIYFTIIPFFSFGQ